MKHISTSDNAVLGAITQKRRVLAKISAFPLAIHIRVKPWLEALLLKASANEPGNITHRCNAGCDDLATEGFSDSLSGDGHAALPHLNFLLSSGLHPSHNQLLRGANAAF